MQTRKRSLEESTAISTFSEEPSATVEPSLLQFPTPPASTSSVPSTPTPSSDSSQTDDRPMKKQRGRRNARTEEEKKARAEERALRNRRAAQESRDRKKKQFELMENENRGLLEENKLLKEKLAALEGKLSALEQLESEELVEKSEEEQVLEVTNDFATTHYPAEVMFHDLQCQAISQFRPLLSRISISPPFSITPSILSSREKKILNSCSPIPIRRRKAVASLTSLSTLIIQRTSSSPQSTTLQQLSSEFRATLDGLNTGSPDCGAEMMMCTIGGRDAMVDERFHSNILSVHPFCSELQLIVSANLGTDGNRTYSNLIYNENFLLNQFLPFLTFSAGLFHSS